jgi:Holliday junction resolvase RusA-like endonuclease
MNAISFFALGTPAAQPRARARARKIFIHGKPTWVGDVYNPPDADQWKRDVGAAARAHTPAEPLTGPINLELAFYFPRPKGHYGSGKNEGKLKDSAPMFHQVRPDAENCIKAVQDALTEMRFWLDDCQIVRVRADKYYENLPALKPGCQITIVPLDNKAATSAARFVLGDAMTPTPKQQLNLLT